MMLWITRKIHFSKRRKSLQYYSIFRFPLSNSTQISKPRNSKIPVPHPPSMNSIANAIAGGSILDSFNLLQVF
jgi:hypothetical protein